MSLIIIIAFSENGTPKACKRDKNKKGRKHGEDMDA
jgi:hypothetical protein